MPTLTSTLATALADTYALGVKTHAAHWNLTGAQFFALHAAFGSQYEALLDAADELAERLRAIGEGAPRGLASLAAATSIRDIGATDGLELAKDLCADHRALSRLCAAGVKLAQAAGDEATADLLIGRIEEHDKTAWMLAATVG